MDQFGRSAAIASQRELNPRVARCCGYEFEDVVADIERASIVTPRHSALSRPTPRIADHLTRRVRVASHINPGMKPHHLEQDVDLFFAQFQFGRDVLSLKALGPWRKQSNTAVCLVEEVWPGFALKHWRQFKPLRQFDHIFLECAASVQIVEDITGVPTSYIPPGVDTMRFGDIDFDQPRPIDVVAIGRRSARTHQSLFDAAERGELFYYYDSIAGNTVWSTSQHRIWLANMLKRTRYFLANTAKFDEPDADSEEIGFRFFEGAASGTVMIGTPPSTSRWDEQFGWEDSIFRLPYHSEEAIELIAELDAQPQRIEAARRRNVAMSMLRHDWVHRWETILASVGMSLSPAGLERKAQLQSRAAQLLASRFETASAAADRTVA